MAKKKAKHNYSKKIQSLLELAANCRFITAEKEKQILPKALEYPHETKKPSVSGFFRDHNVLSEEKFKMLCAIKGHLDLLMADKKFGKIGVANEFVSSAKVQKALDLQVEIFRKSHKSVKIGDILVQSNDMTAADRAAVLLTQDRIKDELLADALNTIAKSELEQMEMNKRFGAIAVKKELIDTTQLNKALTLQAREAKQKNKKRALSDILKQFFNLSDENILSILKVQKKIETRRMDLEKKLEAYNSQKESHMTLDAFFEYHVTDDRLTAFVRKTAKHEEEIPMDEFLDWFSLTGIRYGLCDRSEIQGFLVPEDEHETLEIARGKAPIPFEHEKIDYHFDTTVSVPGPMDNSEHDPSESPVVVKKGDVLATITPHREAEPGTDVFGRSVYLPEEPVIFVSAGQGVAKQQNQFIALDAGCPQLFKNRTLFIVPEPPTFSVLEINGDLTAESLQEDPSKDLKVKGNIVPDIHVACHDLSVDGDIMGHVTATGNIIIKGGIGREILPGATDTGPARVKAAGSIRAGQKIINARVVAQDGLNAPNSDLVSSRVSACSDIVINSVYSSKQAPSILRVTRKNVVELEKCQKAIAALQSGLDKLKQKKKMALLAQELMEQVQVQNGFLEKQNVMTYLNRVVNDEALISYDSVQAKIEAFQSSEAAKDARQITIPENTKAHRFLLKTLEKLKALKPEEQLAQIRGLQDSIAGMYKAAVKATDRISNQFEAQEKVVEKAVEKARPHLDKLREKLDQFMIQKDLLHHGQKDVNDLEYPVVKVKNQAGEQTIITGEKAKTVIRKSVYQVYIQEEAPAEGKSPEMVVKGLFDE